MTTTSAPPQGVINWTPTRLKRLKAAVANAQRDERTEFQFDTFTFHTQYAVYLIQHLNNRFTEEKT